MKLADYEFFPGVAIDVKDPKYKGRVKATVPTIFDPSMDKEGLPWVHPFTMSGYQGFSKLREGSKIWVIRNTKNKNEFWYIPMFELNADTADLINNDDNYENGDVLIARNNGSNSVYIYYNDTDGLMIKYGDKSFININPDSEMTLQCEDAKIILKDNHVYIGDKNCDSNSEPAVKGKQLKTILSNYFTQVAAAATTGVHPYVATFAQGVLNAANSAKESLSTILCDNTDVN